MVAIYRNPASCGSQILEGLDLLDEAWLRIHLKPKYRNYEQREQDGDYEFGYGDDLEESAHIYGGETIVFSDADREGNGKRLAKLIEKYNLGELVSLSCTNPNTSRPITTWLWRYNGNVLPEKSVKLPKAVVSKSVQAANMSIVRKGLR